MWLTYPHLSQEATMHLGPEEHIDPEEYMVRMNELTIDGLAMQRFLSMARAGIEFYGEDREAIVKIMSKHRATAKPTVEAIDKTLASILRESDHLQDDFCAQQKRKQLGLAEGV